MNDTLTSFANILEFTYDTSGQLSDEWKLFDSEEKGIYYRRHFISNLKVNNKISVQHVTLPFINKFFKRDYSNHKFFMSREEKSLKTFNQMPHNFIIKTPSFKSGSQALEIRVRDDRGNWGNWQLITDKFYLIKIKENDELLVLESPIEEHLEEFKNKFQIRYSGLIYKSPYDDISIINEDSIYYLNRNTGDIEFKLDFKNQCYPFENQLESLMKFKNRYYQFDNDGNRI